RERRGLRRVPVVDPWCSRGTGDQAKSEASRRRNPSFETIASLPGGWDLAHAIRLGIKPFAELGASSEALSGSQVDSPCSCRTIFESAPVTMLQSPSFLSLGSGNSCSMGSGHVRRP